MRYTIDEETFAINIFNDNEDVPFQFQPDYPNGDKFDTFQEADNWAKLSIAAHSPDVPIFAPNGKGLVGEPKVNETAAAAAAAKESAHTKLAALGLTAEEIAALSK